VPWMSQCERGKELFLFLQEAEWIRRFFSKGVNLRGVLMNLYSQESALPYWLVNPPPSPERRRIKFFFFFLVSPFRFPVFFLDAVFWWPFFRTEHSFGAPLLSLACLKTALLFVHVSFIGSASFRTCTTCPLLPSGRSPPVLCWDTLRTQDTFPLQAPGAPHHGLFLCPRLSGHRAPAVARSLPSYCGARRLFFSPRVALQGCGVFRNTERGT